ncbi:ABC transporter permease [Angustibacter luteus]|uniref:ABC transporter permease n=1 Tax=Angustibacter luteus TaxID=658456 RepID=A0ABW1JFG9_9ACTN
MHALAAADEPPNPWFSLQFARENTSAIMTALQEHVLLTVVAVLLACLVAFPLAVLAARRPRLAGPVLGISGVIYTIPSLALFAILAPFTGASKTTVLIGLVLYALLVLVRNTLVGLRAVPDEVRDAARGMGYGPRQMLWRVEVPVALPTIMVGVRVATVSTVALVTVGVIVGYGGLGQLLLAGFQNNFYRAEIMTATVLTVALALFLDLLLLLITRWLTPWTRRSAS